VYQDNGNLRDRRHNFRPITFDSRVLRSGLISRVNIENPNCINFARTLRKSSTRQRSPARPRLFSVLIRLAMISRRERFERSRPPKQPAMQPVNDDHDARMHIFGCGFDIKDASRAMSMTGVKESSKGSRGRERRNCWRKTKREREREREAITLIRLLPLLFSRKARSRVALAVISKQRARDNRNYLCERQRTVVFDNFTL